MSSPLSVRSGEVVLLVIVVLLAISGCTPLQSPESQTPEEPDITVVTAGDGRQMLPAETYLAGVTAAEMEPDWPAAALEAQAVAARTFLAKQAEISGGFDRLTVDTSTTKFQAYAPESVSEDVRQALDATHGRVMRHEGSVAYAWYHACAGGKTATAEEGMDFDEEPTPYLRPVDSDFQCDGRQTWEAEFSLVEVQQALDALGHDLGERLETAEVTKMGPSDRAITIHINDIPLSGPRLRLELGPGRMRSTRLTRLEVQGGRLFTAGRGDGHGVGLAQYGARAMANDGRGVSDILHYYFEGVDLQQHWR